MIPRSPIKCGVMQHACTFEGQSLLAKICSRFDVAKNYAKSVDPTGTHLLLPTPEGLPGLEEKTFSTNLRHDF